jgi:hypothetical protein
MRWVALLLAASLAHAQPHPRIASSSHSRSWGAPLVRADGSLDSGLVRSLARHGEVTLPVAAIMARPDIALAIYLANPKCRILGGHLVTHWWLKPTDTPHPNDRGWDAEWQRTLIAFNAWAPGLPGGYEVDWSRRDVADTLTKLLVRAASSRIFDGMFLDYCSPMQEWFGQPGDSARAANMERMVQAVRKAGGCDFWLLGNGVGAERLSVDATVREGFPSALTSFAQALTQNPGDWLKSEGGWSGPYTRDAMRAARFVAGTACLTGAWSSFSPDRDLTVSPSYMGWWYDEHAVTPVYGATGGVSDTTGRWVGWLGEPAGHATQSGPVWRRDFSRGAVLVNPSGVPYTVDMGSTRWRRIRGLRDPYTNNGQQGRYQVVMPRDAVFLVGV